MDILDVSNKEVININRICRFCADINTKLYPIFENKYDEKITSYIQIQVMFDDGLPDMICALCKYKLNTAYDFKMQVLSVDRKLRDLLLNDDILPIENFLKDENNEKGDKQVENVDIKLDDGNLSENKIIKNIEISEISKIVEERKSEQSLNSENDIKIKRKNRKINENQIVECPDCNRKIKKHCFKDHMKTHTRIADRECQICGMMLLTRAALWQHKKTAHGKKQPINCDQCGKNFATNSCFNVHYRTVHLQIKKYRCEICNRSFALPKTLKHHMQVHTGDRPYICQHCGKGVSSPFALKQHIRLHTDEKPFACSKCGEAFKQKVTLKLHFKRIHLGITAEQEKMTKTN